MFRELCRYDKELNDLVEKLQHNKRATDSMRNTRYDCTFTSFEEKLNELYKEAMDYQDELLTKMEARLKEVLPHLIISTIVNEIWEGK